MHASHPQQKVHAYICMLAVGLRESRAAWAVVAEPMGCMQPRMGVRGPDRLHDIMQSRMARVPCYMYHPHATGAWRMPVCIVHASCLRWTPRCARPQRPCIIIGCLLIAVVGRGGRGTAVCWWSPVQVQRAAAACCHHLARDQAVPAYPKGHSHRPSSMLQFPLSVHRSWHVRLIRTNQCPGCNGDSTARESRCSPRDVAGPRLNP